MSVQQLPPTALLTLHVNVPLFCQCVSLHTYWALQKEIIYKECPLGLKWSSLPSNSKQTSIPDRLSPRAPPSPTPSTDLFPLQAETGLLGAGLSSPFMTRSQIRCNGGGRRRCPPTATQPFVCHSSGSGPPPPSPPPRLSGRRSSSQQWYRFAPFDLSLLSQTVYITWSNPLLNRL